MKETKKTGKSILLIGIIFFLLGIIITNESNAVHVDELWDKSTINGKSYDIYCIEPKNPLSNNSDNYKVTDTWEVNGNSVKKNGKVLNSTEDEYRTALQRAYILSTSDTLFTEPQMKKAIETWKNPYPSSAERGLFEGIYSVTSIKQAAIWTLGGFNKWKDSGKYLKYEWDVGTAVVDFVIRRNQVGSEWHYTYTTEGYSEGAFKGVGGNYGMTALNFKSGIDYYTRATNLYKAAISYKGEPTVSLETKGMSSIQPDYTSDSSYVKIGPYVLKHNSRVVIDTTVDSATDLEGNDIKDKIILSTETTKDEKNNITGTKITIKIPKNNMPTSIGKVKIKYIAKNVVTDATIYEMKNKIDGGQNLLSGGGTLKNIKKTIEIPSELTLIPPIKLNLTKKSTLGNKLSGVKFNIEAKQNGSVIAEKNGITSFTTVSGGKTLNWQPTSKDYPIIITITETEVPTGYKVAEPIVITLTYDTTTNKWKATGTTDDENVLDITNNTNIDITITNQYISPIKIGGNIEGFGGFNKVDQAGNPVIGAEFEAVYIQDGKEIFRETVKSDATGKLDFSKVQPETTSNVTVTIEETKAPSGYSKKDYKHTIVFKYGKDGEKVEDKHTWVPISDDTVRVKYKDGMTYVDTDDVENESKIDQLQLLKSNPQNEEKLVGAQFKITLENIKSYGGNSTDATSEDGKLVIYATTTNDGILLKDLVIKDVTNPVIITLEETLAPVGYKKIEGTITLTITRVGTKYTIVTSADESVVNDEFEADVVKIKPGDNGILKGDVNKNGILDAGDALLILKNSVGKYDFDEELKKIADVNGDNAVNSADAKWILDNKTPIPNSGSTIGLGGKGDVNGDGKITEADAEEILKYSVNLITEIDLEKADVDGNGVVNSADALRILKFIAGEKEGATGNVTEESNVITIRMSDIPIMNLGGIVWAEKDKVGKEITLSDKYDNSDDEEALGGITVKLVDIEKNKIVATTTTAGDEGKEIKYVNNEGKEIEVQLSKGQYLFTKLDDGTNYIPVGTGYRVEIDYDGIIYNALTNTDANILYTKNGKSKITLEEDYGLADGTKTISGTENESQSKTTNGEYIIDYTLENSDGAKPDKAIYSKISTEKDGPQAFVTAKSEKYLKDVEDWRNTWTENGEINFNSYMFDVNFGLYTKMFDLALGTDVESATVSINGQTTKYDYDQILDKIGMGQETPYVEKGSKTTDEYEENGNEVEYNLYLTYSDYYYRISDYKVPGDSGAIKNNYDNAEDTVEKLKNNIKDIKKDTELNVNVTYKLLIKNQSARYPASVTAKYYYDEGYDYIGEMPADKKNREISIKDVEVAPGETKVIELEFNIIKDETTGKFKKEPSDTTVYTNKAEIVEYTTEPGRLVDQDSAPGNSSIGTDKANERYEDDTDKANGIVVRFKDKAERSISGKVFEDSNKDSAQNSGEKAVNDVIVQLIELLEIDKKQYEYIWQETVAGSNTVKTTARNGYTGKSYNVENEAGEYKFTQGIIPGNYIVRFIYGDGTTYDITDDTLKYNGEDYKSTYAKYDYNAEWYNNTSLNGKDSKAVDNEARRLKVMSYAVDVDGTKGAELALLSEPRTDNEELKAVLNSTWMCAETLKIKVPVDPSVLVDENGEKEEKLSITENSTSVKKADSQYKVTFDNVNLGLMERPKTKLVLEKHITGLTVRPVASGVSLIANATANIDRILEKNEGEEITLDGQKDGLFAQKSGRNNRGQWYLQTDITELAQGADAYITYTYVIKNEGEQDCLNKELIRLYETEKISEYAKTLSDLETNVKDAKKKTIETPYKNGTYISDFYYTGNTGTNDKEVLASVEELQEALNPKVKFVDSTTDFSILKDRDGKTVQGTKKVFKRDGTGTEDENIKEQIKSTTGTEKMKLKGVDTSKKLVVSVGLSASELENGGVYDSYIAEITHYTNAAGRRDQSTPANLSYVHSYDKDKTLKDNNEEDEFWAERFVITKPTGEDKLTPVQIAVITISAVAVLGVGIILIKKFVLKK